MMKRLCSLGVLLALSAATAGAADVAGHWQVAITTPEGTVTGEASFKQAGHTVTGWVGPSAPGLRPMGRATCT